MTATPIPTRVLNSGYEIPVVGLGTWPLDNQEARVVVAAALRSGYRLIDTASSYENERGVGEGIADSEVPRGELFVTTKLRGSDQGYEGTLRAAEVSCHLLGVDYLDLYLIHWPLPSLGLYLESWRAMTTLRDAGMVRSIGVSNFTEPHLIRLIEASGITPAIDQIELNPALSRRSLRTFLNQAGITTAGWNPLGKRHRLLSDSSVLAVAEKHGRLPSQILLRWAFQIEAISIPKSSDPDRQRANLGIFDFALSDGDQRELDALDLGESAAVDADQHEEY